MIIIDKNVLRTISYPISFKEVESMNLIRRLREEMKTAWTKGVGLAAIQIGVPVRFAYYIFDKKEFTLLNPVILNKWGEDINEEGCLSIPDYRKKIKRAWTIEYINNGKKKKVSGFLARLIQHEVDHMDGVLITDLKRGE